MSSDAFSELREDKTYIVICKTWQYRDSCLKVTESTSELITLTLFRFHSTMKIDRSSTANINNNAKVLKQTIYDKQIIIDEFSNEFNIPINNLKF